MRKAFMLRGQGSGVLFDRVFLRYPTEEDFRAALAYELERHGVAFKRESDASGAERVVGGEARDRWVRVVEVQIVDADDAQVDAPSDARTIMTGALDAGDLQKRIDEAQRVPLNMPQASALPIVGQGTAEVINPGDVATINAADRK